MLDINKALRYYEISNFLIYQKTCFKKQWVKKMPLVKVTRHFQITIPNSVRKSLNIAVGDYVELEEHQDEVVLKPVKMVPADQAYFHSKEWQAGETEADRDIAEGKVSGPFDNVEGLIKALES